MKNNTLADMKSFYDEINKCPDTEFISENGNDLVCLITHEPLSSSFVELDCGHKFNYIPIFRSVCNHKMRQAYKYDEIQCPYCRTIQSKVLPYNTLARRVHGVNHINKKYIMHTSFRTKHLAKEIELQKLEDQNLIISLKQENTNKIKEDKANATKQLKEDKDNAKKLLKEDKDNAKKLLKEDKDNAKKKLKEDKANATKKLKEDKANATKQLKEDKANATKQI